MKKQMVFSACLSLALCMPAFAQTSDTGSSQTKSDSMSQSGMKSGKMGKKMSAVGCIAEKDGKFMLMNQKHPDGIALMSSEDLQPHVGHKVKLTGMMENGSMTNGEAKSDDSSGGNMGMMTMQVTSMKMISTQCNMGGMTKQ